QGQRPDNKPQPAVCHKPLLQYREHQQPAGRQRLPKPQLQRQLGDPNPRTEDHVPHELCPRLPKQANPHQVRQRSRQRTQLQCGTNRTGKGELTRPPPTHNPPTPSTRTAPAPRWVLSPPVETRAPPRHQASRGEAYPDYSPTRPRTIGSI